MICYSCGAEATERVGENDYCKRDATFARQRQEREDRRAAAAGKTVEPCSCAKKHNAPGPWHDADCPRYTPF